jgi:hypothetical protein
VSRQARVFQIDRVGRSWPPLDSVLVGLAAVGYVIVLVPRADSVLEVWDAAQEDAFQLVAFGMRFIWFGTCWFVLELYWWSTFNRLAGGVEEPTR